MRALERHETRAHAIPGREVRDLGHARHPLGPAGRRPVLEPHGERALARRRRGASTRRLTEALALFAALGRRPHVWPSPAHSAPGRPRRAPRRERVPRRRRGTRDGARRPGRRARRCGPTEPGRGVTLHAIRTAADAGRPTATTWALVLAESFGALPGRAAELAADLRRTLDDPRVVLVLVRVDGEPAACAKATTFDGYTYLSSIGTREAFRGRGLAGLATRHAIAVAGARAAGPHVSRRVLGQRAGAPALHAAGVRVGGGVAGHAARMTLWARLTWQAKDPVGAGRRAGAPARGPVPARRPRARRAAAAPGHGRARGPARGSARAPTTTRGPRAA